MGRQAEGKVLFMMLTSSKKETGRPSETKVRAKSRDLLFWEHTVPLNG